MVDKSITTQNVPEIRTKISRGGKMINEQILKKHLMTLVETNYITYDHVTDRYMYRNAIIWIKPYSKYHRIELIVMVNNHVTSQMLHYGDTIKALDLLFYIILNTNHQPM